MKVFTSREIPPEGLTDVIRSYTMSYMNPLLLIEEAEAEALPFQAPVPNGWAKFHKGCCHGRKAKARK